MINLKEVIVQLDLKEYEKIESNFKKNKSVSFLFLLRNYRNSNDSDKNINEQLGITPNAFYVLKSRLYDKIQNSMSIDLFLNQEETASLVLQIPEICYNKPRETAIAFLHKLESQLKRFDMHLELLTVYSTLKKIHILSDKYYHYSQLYNKQVSFVLAFEKAEETLSEFCVKLNQYDFSRSSDLVEQLKFLNVQIINISAHCSSKKVLIIKNLMELQLILFKINKNNSKKKMLSLLNATQLYFDDLPKTFFYKKWEVVLDYLFFEYYFSKKKHPQLAEYFRKVNNELRNIFLYNHVGIVSKFLITKLLYCSELNKRNAFSDKIDPSVFLLDSNDSFTEVRLSLYKSVVCLYQGNYKKGILHLIKLKDEFVLVNHPYINLNIQLTLLVLYIFDDNFLDAKLCIPVINRKIRTLKDKKHHHLLSLLAFFRLVIEQKTDDLILKKQKKYFSQFLLGNIEKNTHIEYLIPLLKKKYYN